MGGELSLEYGCLVDALNRNRSEAGERKQKTLWRRRRITAFESSFTHAGGGDDDDDPYGVNYLSKIVNAAEGHVFDNKDLVHNKLEGLFFKYSALFRVVPSSVSLEVFKMALRKEEHLERYAPLQKEGDNIRKMYIVERGAAHVSLRKHKIRSLKAPVTYLEWLETGGEEHRSLDCGPINEMQLMYDSEASPNVRATSDQATLWNLYREDFRRLTKLVNDATLMQRMRWLRRCPEIDALDDKNLAKLVQNLKVDNYSKGQVILTRKRMTSTFLMIERGECIVSLPREVIPREIEISPSEMDRQLSIIRPPGLDTLRCVDDMNPHMLLRYLQYLEKESKGELEEQDEEEEEEKKNHRAEDKEEEGKKEEGGETSHDAEDKQDQRQGNKQEGPLPGERIAHDPYAPPLPSHTILATSGCIFGIDALRSKIRQGQIEFWQWMPKHFTDEMYLEDTTDDGQSYAGTELPFTMQAKTDVQIVSFSVELLDRIFPSVDIFARGAVPPYDEDGEDDIILSARAAKVEDNDERGEGGGKEEGKDEEEGAAGKYSVRVFPTTSQGEEAFRRERRLLSALQDKCFFPRLAPNREHIALSPRGLTLVTQRCVRGDLWRLIHDPPGGVPRTTESVYLANFYYVQTFVAVNELHSRRMAFRGICPENIGIDHEGNAVLMDLSTCVEECGGRRQTMCGNTEYMAPEMVLGTGHGRAVDMWALGVLLHEMYWGHSPFSDEHEARAHPKYHNDVRKLERILRTMTDWSGVMHLTEHVARGDPTEAHTLAARLVNELVRPHTSERVGYLHEDGPMHLLDATTLFDALELDILTTGKLQPPYNIPYTAV